MLTAIIETAQLSTKKIRNMLSLKEETEQKMKQALGPSFNYDLLQLIFTLPYIKVELLEKKGIAHRQTASAWLKKLTDADIVKPQKIGRTMYFINYKLMDLLSTD